MWSVDDVVAPSFVSLESESKHVAYGTDGVGPTRVHLEDESWALVSTDSLAVLHGKNASELMKMAPLQSQ